MSRYARVPHRQQNGMVEVKSKFDAEFRRFAIDNSKKCQFIQFEETLGKIHSLEDIPFIVTYTDSNGDLLPINNDDNFGRAVTMAKPLLRVMIQRKGESYGEANGYGTLGVKRRNPISKLMNAEAPPKPRINISMPEDFRRVSAIIDVDVVPETHRRVKLMKNGSDKPLGFYIRDGTSVRVTPHGLEKVPGIFISRLVPGGLAESTGLLAVNDEVLEVNGIEVAGKTLDQVTDMMVANSSNLIITVKPVNQRMTLAPMRGSTVRTSQMSTGSQKSQGSHHSSKSFDSDIPLIHEQEDEDDEVEDHLTRGHSGDHFSRGSDHNLSHRSDASLDTESKDSAVVTL